MAKFWDLLKESVIVQGLIALTLIGAWVAIYLQGMAPPEELTYAVFTVLGFYFGSKAGQLSARVKG